MGDGTKLKLKGKLNNLKQKRAGKVLQLDIVVDRISHDVNFNNAMQEVREVVKLHSLIPAEIHALSGQLGWIASNLMMQHAFDSFTRSINEASKASEVNDSVEGVDDAGSI